MNPNPGTATTPAERLVMTRLRLQQALGLADADLQDGRQAVAQGAVTSPAARLPAGSPAGSPVPPATRPGAQLLLATLRAWWARHPLHSAGTLALQTADAVTRPIAQKHPVALLLAATACGAALAWTRPWRHLNARVVAAALVPGLLPSLVPKLLQNLLPLLLPNAAQPWWPHLLRALLPADKPADRPLANQASQRASKKA